MRASTFRKRWVIWRYEMRTAKWTKVPFIATEPRREASSTDPATWRSFAEAVAAYDAGESDGIGYMLGDGLAGIDLDDCRDPDTGAIETWATDIINSINSYSEISPTGTGVKIFTAGTLPPGGRRKGLIELYDSGRYFTITGHHLLEYPENKSLCANRPHAAPNAEKPR